MSDWVRLGHTTTPTQKFHQCETVWPFFFDGHPLDIARPMRDTDPKVCGENWRYLDLVLNLSRALDFSDEPKGPAFITVWSISSEFILELNDTAAWPPSSLGYGG